MVAESSLESTPEGLVPRGDGWFVVNAREAPWAHAPGRSAVCGFEGEPEFRQMGINLSRLAPGEALGMYHWEADQEDFLILAGEALLIVEGVERRLRRWDLVHCPPGTEHIIVGAGDGPCLVVAVGAREHSAGADWGGYGVEPIALSRGVGVEQETVDAKQAYAGLPRRKPSRYRPGWLPD